MGGVLALFFLGGGVGDQMATGILAAAHPG